MRTHFIWLFIRKVPAMKPTICAGLLAVLLAPAIAVAQPRSGTRPEAKITREQATQTALGLMSGRVTDVVIERKRGKYVWVVEIQTARGERDVLVDIITGRIVG